MCVKVYLFDWGDTLMIDFPGVSGKMCDWNIVQAVEGAKEMLSCLSKTADVYVATGASESTEQEIQVAFERVGLGQFISGYFCKSNIGHTKGTPEFLESILTKLGTLPSHVAMVGDSLASDIKPAIVVGIKPIWFTGNSGANIPANTQVIKNLRELCI
jgi:putative hydrolase of the HAD superfamily